MPILSNLNLRLLLRRKYYRYHLYYTKLANNMVGFSLYPLLELSTNNIKTVRASKYRWDFKWE